MHDMKRIAKEPEAFAEAMRNRGEAVDVGALLASDAGRKAILRQAEELKARRNTGSQQVPRLMKEGMKRPRRSSRR